MLGVNNYQNCKSVNFSSANSARYKIDPIIVALRSPQAKKFGNGITREEALLKLNTYYEEEDEKGRKILKHVINMLKEEIKKYKQKPL